ncbi:ABC transporter permease [Phycisphaerales bacterium AB-hyl4]|uniref:ABC transporter permease n=1 Tax=Natronomicrosphaera hydrolytica TaxID=3242702 RepID=A0ABV4UA30_9BACT
MKPIEARNQVKLGAVRCLQLALSGMSYRLFRSLVTVSILALAVAFLVHMLAYGIIGHETERDAYDELRQSRQLGERITRLAAMDSRQAAERGLAGDNADRHAEYQRWASLSAEELDRAREVARQIRATNQHFMDMPLTQRLPLIGDVEPRGLLDRLRDEDRFDRFVARIEELRVSPPLGDVRAFAELVREGRPWLLGVIERLQAGHVEAIEAVREAYPQRSPRELFADPPDDFVEVLQGAGFAVDYERLAEIRTFAQQMDDIEQITSRITDSTVRAAVARQTNEAPTEVSFDSLMQYLSSQRRADWFAGVLAEAGAPARLSGDRVLELSNEYRRERQLERIVGEEAPEDSGVLFGLPPRTLYLISLSFMVCVVGVANAMLMSVTERFTEIATMKCLGAMDGFVMKMFVFEAVIQGLVGGLVGVVLGILLAALRGLAEYGLLVTSGFAVLTDVAMATLLALSVGIGLAAVAAIGPSWVAARLAPMEAMRVE